MSEIERQDHRAPKLSDTSLKRVVAIHDLCAVGKASLNVVLAVLSAMGIRPSGFSTAFLSTHTGYDGFTSKDLTPDLSKALDHVIDLGHRFDAVYSGYLGDPSQVDIISNASRKLMHQKGIFLVDPVMGDDGEKYPSFGDEMVREMRKLVSQATMATPNLTELALLVGDQFEQNISIDGIKHQIDTVLNSGDLEHLVVTSVPVSDSKIAVLSKTKSTDKFHLETIDRQVQYAFSGTGDAFASVLLGYLLQERPLKYCVEEAMKFVAHAIKLTPDDDRTRMEGPAFESAIHSGALAHKS